MPDYGVVLQVEAEEWSPHRYELKEAWLHVRVRAESVEAAGKRISALLAQDGWRLLHAGTPGVIDVSRSPDSAILEEALAQHGILSVASYEPPPPTQHFSTS